MSARKTLIHFYNVAMAGTLLAAALVDWRNKHGRWPILVRVPVES